MSSSAKHKGKAVKPSKVTDAEAALRDAYLRLEAQDPPANLIKAARGPGAARADRRS